MESSWNLLVSFILAGMLVISCKTSATKFTFVNNCQETIWPGVLSNAGWPLLSNGGFLLQSQQSTTLIAPAGWSGRFWARTGCNSFSSNSTLQRTGCSSGDCGANLQCNGVGASPPATLAEFTLSGAGVEQDFYDVSLVDGYNLPIIVAPNGGSGSCGTAGCTTNFNHNCPSELQVLGEGGQVVACKSACEAFNLAQYCCSGAYSSPTTCTPSTYSRIFKAACPNAYSYAFDDPTSTFTCRGTDYTITFCPSSSSSAKRAGGIQSAGQPGGNVVSSIVWAADTSTAVKMKAVKSGSAAVFATGVVILLYYVQEQYGYGGGECNDEDELVSGSGKENRR